VGFERLKTRRAPWPDALKPQNDARTADPASLQPSATAEISEFQPQARQESDVGWQHLAFQRVFRKCGRRFLPTLDLLVGSIFTPPIGFHSAGLMLRRSDLHLIATALSLLFVDISLQKSAKAEKCK
jgi:hypothetical protein